VAAPGRFVRHVAVLDAADVAATSTFWANVFGGRVIDDDPRFHCVIDEHGHWVLGVQHSPGHEAPVWPDGAPQQVHLDLHAVDAGAMHELVLASGARLLRDADDPDADEGHRVYADPAGHPFCIGWGHPDHDALRRFLTD
jgi:catechol 2,3-dioxygenase-like lactoylglutathione lyase family enzyme